MTRYTNVKVNISEGQKEKLQHAIKAGCLTVSIRLGHEGYSEGDIDCIPNTDERYISFAKKKKVGSYTKKLKMRKKKLSTKLDLCTIK